MSSIASAVISRRRLRACAPVAGPATLIYRARVPDNALDLSVVIPVFNEEESLPELVTELCTVLDRTGLHYEIVCIDDGSSDRSFEVLTRISAEQPRVLVGRFRRNFGQTAAIQAGIDAARGRVVAMLDADLQNDPNDIPVMLERLEQGYDLVVGWRADRKDRFINRRLPSMIANWLISTTTHVRLHDYGCTLKLMRAEVAKSIRLYGELHRFIPVLAALVGAHMCELPVNHRARRFGRSKYGIGRTTRVLLDLATVLFLQSYLARPMQVFGFGGLLFAVSGFCISAWLAVEKLAFGAQIGNRPLLTLGVMLILVGVQLLSLGLVADVLGRTYHEAQGKPPYYVRDWVRRGATLPAVVREPAISRLPPS
jgi:glycosyltransferase involved in cell wall biosynthesis